MSTELINTTVVSDVQVTKEDLIAIAMSRHEQDLMAKEIELSSRKKIATKELTAAERGSKNKAEEQAKAKVSSTLEPVAVALRLANFTVDVKTTVNSVSHKAIAYVVSIQEKNRVSNYGHGSVNVSKSGELVPSSQIIALLDEQESLRAELVSIQEKRIEVKKALRNLGTVERSAKAAIAKSVLQQSPEGRAMLEQINSLTGLPSSRLLTGK